MQIKHKELTITSEKPFEHCRLERKKYAEVLTSIVSTYEDGFVLAINNEWGTGKTTFVKMWEQHLKNQHFHTLYFNAWENDFEIDPLAALLGELKKLFPETQKTAFKSLLEKGSILTKNIVPALIKYLIKKHTGKEDLADLLEASAKGATALLEDEINAYTTKKDGIVEFKRELEKYISESAKAKPIIFIIDELDRCRPSYAVEVLEQMKHFFSVPGIVFVLSIDKEQLGNAVRGVYGSEQINVNEYLRRFIDVEYSLPNPTISAFCKYLFHYYDFDSFFKSTERNFITEFHNDGKSFYEFSSLLLEEKNLTLRQVEKLFSYSRLALNLFSKDNYIFPSTFLFLIYLKDYNNKIYQQIKLRKYDLQQFVDNTCILLPFLNTEEYSNYFSKIESLLILTYYNYLKQKQSSIKLLIQQPDYKFRLNIKSSIKTDDSDSLLLRYLESYRYKDFYNIGIDHLIYRIDLLEEIK
ncbi:P-loop NTPase fold protein [Lacibacter sp. H375]|uniref:KAP family P-loop NTPase fold protein n=1 Tax=Lacibacter sp. H375 TaxID=3133424 RepID=UPI0030BBE2E9